jgi:hypothetical protein
MRISQIATQRHVFCATVQNRHRNFLQAAVRKKQSDLQNSACQPQQCISKFVIRSVIFPVAVLTTRHSVPSLRHMSLPRGIPSRRFLRQSCSARKSAVENTISTKVRARAELRRRVADGYAGRTGGIKTGSEPAEAAHCRKVGRIEKPLRLRSLLSKRAVCRVRLWLRTAPRPPGRRSGRSCRRFHFLRRYSELGSDGWQH